MCSRLSEREGGALVYVYCLTCFVLQTNAEYRRGIHYPSDKSLTDFSASLNVLRQNHRQVQHEFGVDGYKKESVIDLREDIQMIAKYLTDKLGGTIAACRRESSYSKMTETNIVADKVGWRLMLSKEDVLREWLNGVIERGELGAVGDAPPDLLAELGLTAEDLDVQVNLDGDGGDVGEVEVDEITDEVGGDALPMAAVNDEPIPNVDMEGIALRFTSTIPEIQYFIGFLGCRS